MKKKAGKYSGESTHSIYYLSDDERSKLETKSINGDAEAAFRLYKYYSFSNYDADEQMRYLAIAASHNNIMVEYAYGIFLSCKNGPYSKYYDLNKAIYWMKLAAAHGHTEAKTELLRLEELK
ncbi:sel1 repeat family protein [Salmonella enterica]|nr:sel1 repeat family protein [Salmonella enterica]